MIEGFDWFLVLDDCCLKSDLTKNILAVMGGKCQNMQATREKISEQRKEMSAERQRLINLRVQARNFQILVFVFPFYRFLIGGFW